MGEIIDEKKGLDEEELTSHHEEDSPRHLTEGENQINPKTGLPKIMENEENEMAKEAKKYVRFDVDKKTVELTFPDQKSKIKI